MLKGQKVNYDDVKSQDITGAPVPNTMFGEDPTKQAIPNEVNTQQVEVEDELVSGLSSTDPRRAMFKKYKDQISPQQIEQWKRQWGHVGLSIFGEEWDEYFIWRPLFADEFLDVQNAIEKERALARQSGIEVDYDVVYRKLVWQRCKLWTNTPDVNRIKAGTLITLIQSIEKASNFYTVSEAMTRTFTL